MSYQHDILCLTETHLDSSIDDNLILFHTDKQIYRQDRNLHGGGVLVAVNSEIDSRLIPLSLSIYPVEVVAVHIPKQSIFILDLVIVCVYMPPGNSSRSVEGLNQLFEFVFSHFPLSQILVMGDFNLPDIDWESYSTKISSNNKGCHQIFLNCLAECNLRQMVNRPTHFKGNILDLVLTSDSEFIEKVEVVEPGLSDHFLVEVELNISKTDKVASKDFYFVYEKADTMAIRKFLLQALEDIKDAIKTGHNIDQLWNIFEKAVKSAVSDFVPKKTIKQRNNREPVWFNSQARKAVCKQRKLYNKFKKTHSPDLMAEYKIMRRENKKMFRKIEQDYYNRVLYEPLRAGISKPFFSFMRRTQGRKNSPSALLANMQSESEMVNNFNMFFQSVFTEADEFFPEYDLPDTSTSPIMVTCEGVEKMIVGLVKGKAPGPDGLRKEDFMVDVSTVSAMLTLVFQYSLNTGSLPSAWKLANVTPVYKKGDKTLAGNYRPVSLTSIACKMLEHIILSYINKSLNLSSHQHGFRHGLSCTTQLVTVVHDLMDANNENQQIHAAVLDFSKAFDKVSHSLLIVKLLGAGVHHSIVYWIQNFLSNRFQKVIINGHASAPLKVHSGVPQGSVLGPTLFLIYIDKVGSVLKHSTIRLFADDALLYSRIGNHHDCINFQSDLTALENWASESKMIFNVTKCQIVNFNFTSDSGVPAEYNLYNTNLEVVDSFKYLGVIITNTLSWDHHITSICTKALQTLGMIKRALFNAPSKVKKIAYLTLCRPVLEYACEVWDPFLVKHISQIEFIQRRAVRFICNLKGVASVTEARENIQLEALEIRRKRARLNLLINILSNSTHSALIGSFNFLMSQPHQYDTRSSRSNAPKAIACNTNTYFNSFIPRTSRDIRLGDH